MYQYLIKLCAEKSRTVKDLDLEPTLDIVKSAVNEFNQTGARALNRKYIVPESLDIHGAVIEFKLQSAEWLSVPTKATRTLISTLAKEPAYSALITSAGRLFAGTSSFIEDKSAGNETMSDEDLLMRLVQMVFRKDPMVEEIKNMILRNGGKDE